MKNLLLLMFKDTINNHQFPDGIIQNSVSLEELEAEYTKEQIDLLRGKNVIQIVGKRIVFNSELTEKDVTNIHSVLSRGNRFIAQRAADKQIMIAKSILEEERIKSQIVHCFHGSRGVSKKKILIKESVNV